MKFFILCFLLIASLNCTRKSSNTENCTVSNDHPYAASDAQTIEWKVSPQFFNIDTGSLEQTPCLLISKTKKAFELWESITASKVKFVYSGYVGSSASAPVINVYFDGQTGLGSDDWSQVSTAAGLGGFLGTIPNNYVSGSVAFHTQMGLYALSMKTIVHEIGHALGLEHQASNASIMSCGTAAWADYDVLGFGTQDVANFIDLWGSSSDKMSISGKVVASQSAFSTQGFFFVFAVDVVKGVTFSALTDAQGVYKINILRSMVQSGQISGQFRVFAKGYDFQSVLKVMEISPSWWISNGSSTNNPTGGSIITLSDSQPTATDIDVTLIEQPPSVNLFWGFDEGAGDVTKMRSFLLPGTTVTTVITSLKTTPSTIQSYGTNPDYSLANITQISVGDTPVDSWNVTVTVQSGAVPGERLILLTGNGSGGMIQAGLAGFQVIGSTRPGSLGTSSSDSVREQLSGAIDFSVLDPYYWLK